MNALTTKLLVSLLALAIAGCVSAPARSIYWVKPGGTQGEFNQTRARCNMQVATLPGSRRDDLDMNSAGGNISAAGRDLQDIGTQLAYFNDCMVASGWTAEQR